MSALKRSESVVRFQAATVLLATSLGYAAMAVRLPHDPRVSPIVVYMLPVAATLMFLVVTYIVPNLLAPRRLAFPLMVTLPVIYCALLAVCVTLFTSSDAAVFQAPEALIRGRIWAQPAVLVQVGISQVCALTVLSVIPRGRVLS